MKPSKQDQFKLSEEAALWVVRLSATPDAQLRGQFFEWARQSPRHMEEFMFAKAVSTQLNGLDPQHKIQIDRAALTALGEDNVVTLARKAPAASRRRLGWVSSIAASAIAAALGWLLLHSVSDPKQAYVTATGDQQSIKLRDGSLVQLNTHSRIEVTYSAGARQVRLLEGEALFIVAQDPARPFRVYTDSATIQAIGTQFNVYRRVNGTRVSVVEGIVQVSRPAAAPVRLEAGAEADIAADRVTRTAKPDVDRAVAWRARRLVFHSDRLEDVAREFNRYNRDQIRLDGVGVADRRISGVFDADDTQPLIEFLNAQPGFSVTQAGRETVIRVR